MEALRQRIDRKKLYAFMKLSSAEDEAGPEVPGSAQCASQSPRRPGGPPGVPEESRRLTSAVTG